MYEVSENRDNFCITFTKQEVEDLHILCDQLLELDFSGDEDNNRLEKTVNKFYDVLDGYLERNGNPADCLVP